MDGTQNKCKRAVQRVHASTHKPHNHVQPPQGSKRFYALFACVLTMLCFAPFALLCSGFDFGSPAPSFLANHLFLLLVFYLLPRDVRFPSVCCAAAHRSSVAYPYLRCLYQLLVAPLLVWLCVQSVPVRLAHRDLAPLAIRHERPLSLLAIQTGLRTETASQRQKTEQSWRACLQRL